MTLMIVIRMSAKNKSNWFFTVWTRLMARTFASSRLSRVLSGLGEQEEEKVQAWWSMISQKKVFLHLHNSRDELAERKKERCKNSIPIACLTAAFSDGFLNVKVMLKHWVVYLFFSLFVAHTDDIQLINLHLTRNTKRQKVSLCHPLERLYGNLSVCCDFAITQPKAEPTMRNTTEKISTRDIFKSDCWLFLRSRRT